MKLYTHVFLGIISAVCIAAGKMSGDNINVVYDTIMESSPSYCNLYNSVLINSAIVANELVEDENTFAETTKDGKALKFRITDIRLKKALSMALMRAAAIEPEYFKESSPQVHLRNETNIESEFNSWQFFVSNINENVITCFGNRKLLRFFGVDEDIDSDCDEDDEYAGPSSINAFPGNVLMPFFGHLYSAELAEIIGVIVNEKKEDAPTPTSSVFSFYKNNMRECSIDELSNKYDFYMRMRDQPVVFQAGQLGDEALQKNQIRIGNPLALSGDSSHALVIALLRLKLSVGDLDDMAYPYSGRDIINNGAIYELEMNLADGGKYLVYVKGGRRDIVGIHNIKFSDLSSENGMPLDGIYYSPEFYRMVMTVFADIFRTQFLGNYSMPSEDIKKQISLLH